VAEACQEAPSVVVLLNPGALPKTSSGKLQRSACRTASGRWQPRQLRDVPVRQVQIPNRPWRLPSCKPIGKLWAEQLNLKQVNADDHFFLLGGNSIAATQVIAKCAKNWAWS
jgi:hypothetical protein